MMKKEELVQKTDNAIQELVCDKIELLKAYNYYNCKRDKELFLYLEDNYGIGLPTSIKFIPLIRKHVDALIGEFLNTPIIPKVSCKDEKTINNIFREKQLKINEEVFKYLSSNLKNNLIKIINNQSPTDLNIKELLDRLIEDINENFVSEYEIAGLNIIQYIIQSRDIDLINKLRQLLIDLLVTGYTFYRVIRGKENLQIEVLNPLNTFVDLNYDSPYIKNSYRSVVRKYLTKSLILAKYGKLLNNDDLAKIRDLWDDFTFEVNDRYMEYPTEVPFQMSSGIRMGEEVLLGYPYDYNKHRNIKVIPVYEVEWIETDKDFILHRYSTVRINLEIYILYKEDEDVVRTKNHPERCSLRVNGIYYNNRGTEPYSLVQACMDIQDKYDLTIFYRDCLIANSGTVGDWVNVPTLPAFLGNSLEERIVKWILYKKAGIGLMDTSQEGQLNTGQAPLNTLVNGFDDTIKAQAIQGILMVIDSLEATASSITGVFRERLNGIQLRDAVTNVQVGINNSFTVTKQWFFEMDLVLDEILTDSLNMAKFVYKNGLTGTYILGHKYQKIFTALPKYYTNTDFDIHVLTSTEILKLMEQIKQLIPDLISGNIVSPDILMDILTSLSLTEMKVEVKKALKKQKAENNQLLQMTQQLEQMQNELQQTQKQLQQAQLKIEQLNEAKLNLERTKMLLLNQVEMYKAKTDRTYKESTAKNDTKRTEIELLLLRDGNPYNDEIRNV